MDFDEHDYDDDPNLEVGERVKHRASGKFAIVTVVYYVCTIHAPVCMCVLRINRDDCKLERTGIYKLSFGFKEEADEVHGYLLTRAPEKNGDTGFTQDEDGRIE